jgi:ferric-dicitrate binding protein FerR (iron transport regulator)
VGLAAVAAGVAFVVALLLSPEEEVAVAATSAAADVTGAPTGGERGELELPDGSRVTPGPEARLRIVSSTPEDVELMLLRGAAEVTVSHAAPDPRRFVMAVGDFDVVVKSGRLRVSASGGAFDRRVEVTVVAGSAEVHRHSAGRPTAITLGAGETWASDVPGTSATN